MAEIVRYYVKHLLTFSVCMKQVQGYLFLVIKNIKQCTFVEKSNKKIVKNLLRFFFYSKKKKAMFITGKIKQKVFIYLYFLKKIKSKEEKITH